MTVSPEPEPSRPDRGGRWSRERRLAFIDFRLCWDGRLNRRDLTEFFGISVPQASLDIARYTDLAPGNLHYDRSERVYVASPAFKAVFDSSSAASFLDTLLRGASDTADPSGRADVLGNAPTVALVPGPHRAVRFEVLAPLQRAVRERAGLTVVYQSLTRASPTERTISPHAFAHDGRRWHVRAFCHTRDAFRDFVIARILEVRGPAEVGRGAGDDTDWNTTVRLVLTPHPDLPESHRRAVALDYGMTRGTATLECRRAFLFYVLRHLGLDRNADDPKAQQIVLKNRREVERHLASRDDSA